MLENRLRGLGFWVLALFITNPAPAQPLRDLPPGQLEAWRHYEALQTEQEWRYRALQAQEAARAQREADRAWHQRYQQLRLQAYPAPPPFDETLRPLRR